jgi:serine protease AprX
MTTPSRRVRSRITRVLGVSALGVVLAISGTANLASAGPASEPTAGSRSVIIVARPGQAPAALSHITALGGKVTRELPLVDGFAADVPNRVLPALRSSPAIRSLTPDAAVQLASLGARQTATVDPEPTSVYPQALRADRVWREGNKGQGVTVALIDTGVSSSPDLSGRMVSVKDGLLSPSTPCKNLSGEPSCQDNYGHGTFVGGVIAGDGSASGGTYTGVAPGAKLLSVKVAGADGSTDVSNILAAIQWVVSYRSTYSIRVLNLSLSTDSTQTYLTDPFNYAVERAWDAGIVVVVSASNRGPGASTISKPGDDPLVITVGSTDDRGTPGIEDDELPDFSSRGPTIPDGLAKPDLVAPGSHLMSLRSVGSTIDRQLPSPTGAYHRGSGTSFSAAATSGVVALMLAAHPGMQPDQVKYALKQSSRTLPAGTDPAVVGAGTVDASRAVLDPPAGAANVGVIRSNGTGLLDASRGHVTVQTTTVPGTLVNGTLTAQLVLWNPTGYLLGWSPVSWVVSPWALTPFQPVRWSDDDWSGRNWGGRNWGGGTWQGSTWNGAPVERDYGSPTDGALWYGAWG